MIKGEYVCVRNAMYKNITFPGGGCKLNELANPRVLNMKEEDRQYYLRNKLRNCAIRELYEETKESIKLFRSNLPDKATFYFKSTKRSPEEQKEDNRKRIKVTLIYLVYVIDIGDVVFNNIKKKFKNQSNLEKKKFKNQSNLEKNNIKKIRQKIETNQIHLLKHENIAKTQLYNIIRNDVLPHLK